mmetsp:Transcript_12129/g.20124  ORF Transcript_12129/g.20124 Transcript_12129/m.20124 type:complete len:278 (-) Transcript_12129:81-914(-)|eukprot:CAMPEP_0119023384 /NCGR_PEP_ID=MMETSP1176-20130426/29867_1 /TAXON_ID=265551 /ORGANISM="Synedropsis recta cf, Strain CCMP1620" /LENGTH=277 /DNA_ID=CAMNT_0006978461 /DNA_START=142 /DNA_END=975 /DNA_ORIENTATION=+
MEDLKDKHARGVQERDDPDRAPTGEPYRQLQHQSAQRARMEQTRQTQEREMETRRIMEIRNHVERQMKENDNSDNDNDSDDDDSDDEWLDELENDPALEALREQRLEQLKQQELKLLENKAKGHGQYRTIAQDEFLPECTNTSEWVVVHFFHHEFIKCQVMDHHLTIVAHAHAECKFLRIDAQKAPFFCGKLQVQTLPTVLVFQNGKAVDRLVGFEGIADNNEWPTALLQKWLAGAGAIQYTPPSKEIEEEMKRLGISVKGSIWRGGMNEYNDDGDE